MHVYAYRDGELDPVKPGELGASGVLIAPVAAVVATALVVVRPLVRRRSERVEVE